jgi:hypothetical protein
MLAFVWYLWTRSAAIAAKSTEGLEQSLASPFYYTVCTRADSRAFRTLDLQQPMMLRLKPQPSDKTEETETPSPTLRASSISCTPQIYYVNDSLPPYHLCLGHLAS